MPRIRWWRREGDQELAGIECVCGGDMLPAESPGVYRCARCGRELREPRPPEADPVTGERGAPEGSALEAWIDEQRYKRAVSRRGGRSSSRRRRRRPAIRWREPLDT